MRPETRLHFLPSRSERPSDEPPGRDRQLLVAASPNDRISDTHWYRAEFDAALVEQARDLGVHYLDQVHLKWANQGPDRMRMGGHRSGEPLEVEARFVLDASGPRGFLHRALGLEEAALPGLPHTQALYSHFAGVPPLPGPDSEPAPPYPPNDAAVHHLFDGGWIWVLQFSNGITSAGVVARDDAFERLGLAEGEPAWQRLISRIPMLREQFSVARAILPFARIPRLAFRSLRIAGPRWALLPSAAGFVDPLLSTGFPLVLLGIGRLAKLLDGCWENADFPGQLAAYAAKTDAELVAAGRLIAALYANLCNFPTFVALTMLYFAAASFAETARRLNRPDLVASFLLYDDPRFGPASAELLARALRNRTPDEDQRLREDIAAAIGPFNIAGLADPAKDNWYGVDAGDLFRGAAKLGVGAGEIQDLLMRCGFIQPSSEKIIDPSTGD